MTELAHTLLTAEGAAPERWLLFLHGIYGAGSNWRSFARRLIQARPQWGAALVDLRMHGSSQGLAGPHTVAAAAEDLVRLEAALPGPVRGIVGHSFGGKVALAYLAQRGEALLQTWVLDATPGPRPDHRGSETTVRVLELLEALPPRLPDREALIGRLVEAGLTRDLGQWLAMNLEREPDGFRLRLDTAAVRALLEDYFATDLWPVLEAPPGDGEVHVVVGGRSRVFSAEDRARLERAALALRGRLSIHVLPEAGHWVHVDDPEGLYQAMVGAF